MTIIVGLNSKNGNPYYGDKNNPNTPFVVANSNHFVYAKLNVEDLEDGVVLDMMVGNKFDVVGKALVKLDDNGNLVITINGQGVFGAIAFNKDTQVAGVPKNGNIHSQKEADLKSSLGATTGFNHNNQNVIPRPTTDDGNIYLYIHCDSLQFFNEILAW